MTSMCLFILNEYTYIYLLIYFFTLTVLKFKIIIEENREKSNDFKIKLH